MKKKKVDKILKGVVTAGVALGGASFMTEADMVYAAELGEQGEEEEFEQAGLEQDEEVDSTSVEEALDTDTSSDETAPAETASSEETAPAEEASTDETAPAEEASSEETAPASGTSSEETALASETSSEETTPASETSSEETTPVTEMNSEEKAPAEESAPAEEKAPVTKNAGLNDEEALVDKAPVLRMAKAPILTSSASTEGETNTSGEQTDGTSLANLESEAYQAAIADLQSANNALVEDSDVSWDDLREYVGKYITADLSMRGATDIKFSDWQKADGKNKHYEVTFLGADGEYHAEYYGYTTSNGRADDSNITIQQKNPHMDDQGCVTFNNKEDVAWRTFNYKTDDVKSNLEANAQNYEEQIQRDSQNSGVASYLSEDLENAINDFRDAEKNLETGNVKNSWRALTLAYAKVYILMNGGSNVQAGKWTSYNDHHEDYHNVEVSYTDANNEEQSVYFDYVTLNKDGNWDVYNLTRDGAILLKTPTLDENGKVATDGKHMLFEVNGEESATNTKKGMELIRIYASKASSQAYKALLDISDQIKETVNNQDTDNTSENQTGEETTPSTGGNEAGEETTPSTGGNEAGEETTPSTGGNEAGEETTPSTGGNEAGEGTTPSTGGNEAGEETTPATGGNENAGGTTPTTGGNDAGEETTPATGGNDAGEETTPPTGGNENSGNTPVTGGNENNGTTPATGGNDAGEETTPPTGGNENNGNTPITGGNENNGNTPITGGNEAGEETTPTTGGNEPEKEQYLQQKAMRMQAEQHLQHQTVLLQKIQLLIL